MPPGTPAASVATWCRRASRLVSLAAAGLAFASAPARAAGEAAPPAAPETSSAGCASCHARLLEGKKHVHSAVETVGCGACHEVSGAKGRCASPASSGWKLSSVEPGLCASCHDMQGKAPAHPVIEALGCTACHDPHASENPAQLKQPAEALCSECHGRKDETKTVHTAVRRGLCLGCHDPHAGAEPPLLKKPRAELCVTCHATPAPARARAVHSPVARGQCLDCHDPHGSDRPRSLRKEGTDLCLSCHSVKPPERPSAGGAQAAGSAAPADAPPAPVSVGAGSKVVDLGKKNVHPAVEAVGCDGCHAPHASPVANQLTSTLPKLCYGCHDRKDAQPYVHGAVQLGRCTGCHDPHASDAPAMLRASKTSDLCFRCHSDDVTGRKHVHAPVAKGECASCHEPHASQNARLLAKPQVALCRTCHSGIADKQNVHGAVRRFGCTACHDAHASANALQLIQLPNKLCLQCHPKITGDHVFVSFDGRAHPMEGKPDRARPGKQMTCASCHDPHSSENPKLFRTGTTKMEVCSRCHDKF